MVGKGFFLAGQIYDSFLVVVTILGAILIYASFYANISLRTKTNAFFVSLVTADLLTATLVMSLDSVHLAKFPKWPFSRVTCNVWNSLFVALGTSSLVNLTVMSIDKVNAITRPLYYSTEISKKTLIVLGCTWMYAVINGIYLYFLWEQPDVPTPTCRELSVSMEHSIPLLILNVFIPFSVCLATNVKILKISREQAIRVNAVINLSEQQSKLKAKKGARTISLLVGAFSFCVLPFFIFHAIDAISNESLPGRLSVSHIAKWLLFSNSALNWALYGFLNREFRTTFARILRIMKKKVLSGFVARIPIIKIR
ncbi:octopamine receptor 1-like [Actinia tenebrosa]|uniref:Octopamine receptor 1-like n=1 Tax=Actinia tenebrosa TaxID=6105 RepID=A0A6P8HIV9_ACTTE|nr:octopamine receptor 1-like [Actinia tenebrosa]